MGAFFVAILSTHCYASFSLSYVQTENLASIMRSEQIPYAQASTIIRKVDPVLADALDRLFSLLPDGDPEKSSFIFTRAEYPYGDTIVNQGMVESIHGQFNENHLGVVGFPLALIVDGCAEVHRDSIGVYDDRICDVILRSGKFIGIFEYLRFFLRDRRPAMADWNISSGVTSLYLSGTINKTKTSALRKKHGSVDHDKLKESCLLYKQVSLFPDLLEQLRSSWHSTILYFPTSLLVFLYEKHKEYDGEINHPDPMVVLAISELRRILSEAGWPTVFDEIEPRKSLVDLFSTTRSREVFHSILRISRNEKYIYTLPCMTSNGRLDNALDDVNCSTTEFLNSANGMLAAIQSEFVDPSGLKADLYAPYHVQCLNGRPGFIPFSHMVPPTALSSLAGKKQKESIYELQEIFREIARTLNAAEAMGFSVEPWREFIDGMRIKFGSGGGKNRQHCVVSFRSHSNGKDAEFKPIEHAKEFFSGIEEYSDSFSEDQLPLNKALFSRTLRVHNGG